VEEKKQNKIFSRVSNAKSLYKSNKKSIGAYVQNVYPINLLFLFFTVEN